MFSFSPPQSVNEWGVILRSVDNKVRRSFLGMALASEGLSFAELPYHLIGLKRMLEPLLVPIHPGSQMMMFAASYHRSAMQVIIKACR